MRTNHRLHPALGTALLALCLFSCGCRTGLGPRLVAQDRFDYNQQIIRSSNEQMLLNLVRLHYNDIPLFLELGSVVVQFGIEGRASAGGRLNLGAGQGSRLFSTWALPMPNVRPSFTSLSKARNSPPVFSPRSLTRRLSFWPKLAGASNASCSCVFNASIMFPTRLRRQAPLRKKNLIMKNSRNSPACSGGFKRPGSLK